jgi:hypothetical protein
LAALWRRAPGSLCAAPGARVVSHRLRRLARDGARRHMIDTGCVETCVSAEGYRPPVDNKLE